MKHIWRLLRNFLSQHKCWFIYVDCGARNEKNNQIVEILKPYAKYVGFEPDKEECDKLCYQMSPEYMYVPFAVGKDAGEKILNITQNPSCSSLLIPDYDFFGKFLDCSEQIEVTKETRVNTVALDDYLSKAGISNVDFLELDIQGGELAALQGAKESLLSKVLAVRVEVEFSALYQNQPLFSDIDVYLRKFGFMLFDLSRHYYRRKNYPSYLKTRGQLLYGHAFYLKDYRSLPDNIFRESIYKILFITSFYGFHDYTVEILDFSINNKNNFFSPAEKKLFIHTKDKYLGSLSKKYGWNKWFAVKNSRCKKVVFKIDDAVNKIRSICNFMTKQKYSSWVD